MQQSNGKKDPDLVSADAAMEESLPAVPKERYDLRILSSLRRIIRSVDSYSKKLASDYGMTVPQLLCMLKIEELGPLTLKELSKEVYLNPSTIVGIVDRLEKSGILTRERSEVDRRRVRISLTERGRDLVRRSPSPLQDSLVRTIEKLPELERATIALSLERILSCISAQEEEDEAGEIDAVYPVLDSPDALRNGDEASRLGS